jgi:hypothetical protein
LIIILYRVKRSCPIEIIQYWRNGIRDFGIVLTWLEVKISVDENMKDGYLLFKNQHSSIPPFLYSMVWGRSMASLNEPYPH